MLPTDNKAGFSLAPQNFEQATQFAQMLAESDFVPKDFKAKPGNCLIAMQWGYEVGMQPLQSLQNISVINGRPAMWGDALMALVRNSPLCEYLTETDDGHTATIRGKRKGQPEEVRTFSMEDAQLAGLVGKAGPWTQYPKRMRQMRARAFLLRDLFADVLRGMAMAEEVMDMKEVDMGPAQVVTETASAKQAQPETYPDTDFDTNLPKWTKLITAGKKSADDIIRTVESKAPLTDKQKKALKDIAVDVTTVDPAQASEDVSQ
jgi:hypothetical protein